MTTLDLLQTWATFSPEMVASTGNQDMLSPKVTVVEGQTLKPSVTFMLDADVLLGKGNFEGDLSWISNPLAGSNEAWDESRSYSGTRSLRLGAIAAATTTHGPVAGPFNVVPGDRFAVRIQVYGSSDFASADENSKVRVYNHSDGAVIVAADYTVPPSEQWGQRSTNFTIGAGITQIAARLQRNGATGSVWLDNLLIEQYTTTTVNVVELHMIAYGAAGNILQDTVFAQKSVGSNSVLTLPWTTLGNTDYVVPAGATKVQMRVRLRDTVRYGKVYFRRPRLTMETLTAPGANAGYGDRWRFAVEDRHGTFLTRDLIPVAPAKVVRNLSGPASIEFKVHYSEPSVQMADGSGAIQFKPYGQLVHALKEDQFGNEIVWASCIVQPSDIDPASGVLDLRTQGFSGYAKGLPWLENWNPIAVDPFEVVERIWNHIQSYAHGNLGVTVYPTSSGTQMLPGFSFNNEEFVQDFFAIFIREIDRQDCGDYINKLARDIPFDYFEESAWNASRTDIIKKIRLGYPSGGFNRTGLVFRPNENIRETKQKQEVEKDWFSDISLKGYFPGKQYSVQLGNADPDRLRRVVDELDLKINSQERAAAWAKRLLTRRQTPNYYESIIIDPYHSNAPFGTFDVGDNVLVEGPMPWKGDMKQIHKVLAHVWDEEKNVVQLALMAEGAFNYDPIEYIPL